jgi:hypothetical protein
MWAPVCRQAADEDEEAAIWARWIEMNERIDRALKQLGG